MSSDFVDDTKRVHLYHLTKSDDIKWKHLTRLTKSDDTKWKRLPRVTKSDDSKWKHLVSSDFVYDTKCVFSPILRGLIAPNGFNRY